MDWQTREGEKMWIRDMTDSHLVNAERLLRRGRHHKFTEITPPPGDEFPIAAADYMEDAWEMLDEESHYFYLLGDLLLRGIQDADMLCDRRLELVARNFDTNILQWGCRDHPWGPYYPNEHSGEKEDNSLEGAEVASREWIERQEWFKRLIAECDARGVKHAW
jgi:hypothetical protein